MLVFVCGSPSDSIVWKMLFQLQTGSEWAVFSYTGRYATILKTITAMGVNMVPETH